MSAGHVDFGLSLDCKTVLFFANASDRPYSNERSGASTKTARENVRLARFTLEDHAYRAYRLPKTTVLQSRANTKEG